MTDSSRLSRIEASLASLKTEQKNMHQDLRDGLEQFQAHDKRLNALERVAERHEASFRFLKWVGAGISTALSALHLTHK